MRTPTTLAATALLLACTPRPAPPVPAGKPIFDRPATALAASPDGGHLAWLAGCGSRQETGRALPGCTLVAAPVEGGAPVAVAEAVAPSAGSFAWMPDGSLAALARRDPVTGAGDLVSWRAGAAPRVLAPRVTSFSGGPGGALAFAADGEVHVAQASGNPVRLAGGSGAFEVAFAPAPARAVVARTRQAGGAQVLLLWRGAAGDPVVVARDVGTFAFSSDGAWLAAVAGVVPGTEGDLVAVPVDPAPGSPAAPVPVARAVGPFQWAPGAPRLAWLEGFDPRGHAGRLASAPPGGAPVVQGDRVTAFELSPGGVRLAFVRHVTAGGYSANLDLSPSGAAAAGTVSRDAAGFSFSPDGNWLWYRAACTPAGDGCALFRVPAGGLAAGQPAERLADGVSAFAVGPGPGERVLVSLARRDGAGIDLSAWNGSRLVPLDGQVLPGSAILLPPDGRRATWIGASPGRPGVFVGPIP